MKLIKNFSKKFFQLYKKENIFFFIIIFFLFALDRITKIFVINNYTDNKIFINNFINFDLTWNIGIGFGLLSYDSSLIYNIITIIITIVILILFYTSVGVEKIEKYIFSIIIGGALGNFYDRLTLNAVPDFIDIHYNNFHWFTFNVADIFITLGIIAFLMKGIFEK
jgi:signal peptidase II